MAFASSELSVADHLRLAQENLSHADWLRSLPDATPTQLAWAVTAVYYAALHAASGYVLSRHGERVVRHSDRDRWFRVGGFPEFSRVDREDYQKLKFWSEAGRYEGNLFTVMQVDALRNRGGQFIAKFSARTLP